MVSLALNQTAERNYRHVVEGIIAEFPIHRGCPPALSEVGRFCYELLAWLEGMSALSPEHPDHVAAVHCSDGYSRTGLLLCCVLLQSKKCLSVSQAIQTFLASKSEHREVADVFSPTYLRYLHYYEAVSSPPA